VQYLFGAPEGFSRLVLEHKIRPTAALNAIFSLRPNSLVSATSLLIALIAEFIKRVMMG